MTELVDEFFEHPKPRNDDVMDALYYSDYYARAPKSSKVSVDSIQESNDDPIRSIQKKAYSWMPGARL